MMNGGGRAGVVLVFAGDVREPRIPFTLSDALFFSAVEKSVQEADRRQSSDDSRARSPTRATTGNRHPQISMETSPNKRKDSTEEPIREPWTPAVTVGLSRCVRRRGNKAIRSTRGQLEVETGAPKFDFLLRQKRTLGGKRGTALHDDKPVRQQAVRLSEDIREFESIRFELSNKWETCVDRSIVARCFGREMAAREIGSGVGRS